MASNAERQARFRAKRDAEIERLPHAARDGAELIEARKEIERLRNAATASADSPELIEARAEIERLRKGRQAAGGEQDPHQNS